MGIYVIFVPLEWLPYHTHSLMLKLTVPYSLPYNLLHTYIMSLFYVLKGILLTVFNWLECPAQQLEAYLHYFYSYCIAV